MAAKGAGETMSVAALQKSLVDPFGRTVDYIRVSVTDRCDFRCVIVWLNI